MCVEWEWGGGGVEGAGGMGGGGGVGRASNSGLDTVVEVCGGQLTTEAAV